MTLGPCRLGRNGERAVIAAVLVGPAEETEAAAAFLTVRKRTSRPQRLDKAQASKDPGHLERQPDREHSEESEQHQTRGCHRALFAAAMMAAPAPAQRITQDFGSVGPP